MITNEMVEKACRARMAAQRSGGILTDADWQALRSRIEETWMRAALEAVEDDLRGLPPVGTELSRENEPPVGTWVRDRFGAATMRQPEGWGQPGVMPFGRWHAMWDARGPYTVCNPWGQP